MRGILVTTMFEPFFGLPQQVMRTGMWAQLKPAQQGLYVAVLYASERRRSRSVSITDAEIGEWAGVRPRALRAARIKLKAIGLLDFGKGTGNVYTYVVCNPETGKPWPGDPRVRVRYTKKAERQTAQEPIPAHPPTAQEPTPAKYLHSVFRKFAAPASRDIPRVQGLSGVFEDDPLY